MKKVLLLGLAILLASAVAFGQSRTVTGTVTSGEDGNPIPGVSVLVKGTTVGTATDLDGQYSVEVPANATVLVFSFMGMESQEVAINNQSTIDVELGADAQLLSEVVVVGYGTTTKQAFAGSMKEVDSELIERKSVSNASQALAGEVAGVRVINTSGQPGSTADVRIRGIGSVNGNRDPLYVVDGVPFFGNINSINPSDIENMTVLKDATATSIYGSRGANGVILINTRKGKAGSSFIEVDGKVGKNFDLLPRYETISSPEEYIAIGWNGLYNRGVATDQADPTAFANNNLFSGNGVNAKYNLWDVDGAQLIDPATGMVREGVGRKYNPENWEDYAFQASNRSEATLKIGGGSEKVNYFTSFGYLNDVGYSINSDFERVSARMNVNHQVKEWLSGGLNIGYSRSETNTGGQTSDSGSIFWFMDNMPSIYPLFLRDENGDPIPDPYYGGYQYDYGEGRGFAGLTNAIADATYGIKNEVAHEVNGNANLNIDFTKDLRFESRYGWQYFMENYDDQDSPFYGPSASSNGSIYKTKTEVFSYNMTNILRYSKDWGDHSLEAMIAQESSSWDRKFLSGFKQQLVDPFGVEFNNAVVTNPSYSYTRNYALESYFGQVSYDFDDTYYFTGTIRRDGSSRFVKDKWGTFGAVGLAWVASNEEFMASQDLFSFLKFKASYGLTGDQAGVGLYPGYDLLEMSNLDGAPSLTFYEKGNPDLTWETSKMFQVGTEFRLGTFLDGSLDYYIKNTDNLIFERSVATSLGGYEFIQVNDGVLNNSGLEFDLVGHILKGADYYIDLGVNGEVISNKLKHMPIDPGTGEEKPIEIVSYFGRSAGHSIFDFYMREWAGVDSQTGEAMWNMYYDDANSDGEVQDEEVVTNMVDYLSKNPDAEGRMKSTTTTEYSDATRKYVGKSAIPKVRGAVNFSAGYKGFDLTVLMLYSIGGYAYDFRYADLMANDQVGNSNWHVDIRDRWMQEGDVTDVPRLTNDFDQNVNSTSTRFLTKSDYLNISNIRLGYTFPKKLLEPYGVQYFNLFVAGDNLMLSSARKGFNPSTNEAGTSSRYRYSPLSTVTLGAKVRF